MMCPGTQARRKRGEGPSLAKSAKHLVLNFGWQKAISSKIVQDAIYFFGPALSGAPISRDPRDPRDFGAGGRSEVTKFEFRHGRDRRLFPALAAPAGRTWAHHDVSESRTRRNIERPSCVGHGNRIVYYGMQY